MAYFGNEPAKVAVKVGSGVITATELADDSITTADIIDDAITPNQLDEDGTGFQVGTLGIGAAVSGGHALVVSGSSTTSGNVLATGGHIRLDSDSHKFTAGAGQDFQFYHDGSNSRINNTTGHIIINQGHSGGNLEFEIQGSGSYVWDSSPATFAGLVTITAQTSAYGLQVNSGSSGSTAPFYINHGGGSHTGGAIKIYSANSGNLLTATASAGSSTFSIGSVYNNQSPDITSSGGATFGGDVAIEKSSNPTLTFTRNEGTITDGEILGKIAFAGHESTPQAGAIIQGVSDGAWGTNDLNSRLEFYTAPDGSGDVVKRLTIDKDGKSTFTGAVIQSMSNPYTKMIDTSSGGDDYGLNNNSSKFSIYNWTDGREELYFGGDGNATFVGDLTLNGDTQLETAYTNLQLYMPDNATGLVLANGSSQSNARNWGIYTNYSHWGALDFRVSSANGTAVAHTTQVLSLKRTGHVEIDGDLKLMSGHKLEFEDSASGGGIDDYEEGTYSWKIYTSNGNSSNAEWQSRNAYQLAQYIKIGDVVTVSGRWEVDAQANASTSSDYYVFMTVPFAAKGHGSHQPYSSVGAGTFNRANTGDSDAELKSAKPIIFQGDSYLHWQMASGTSSAESYIKGFSDSNFEGHFCITYRTA